MRIFATLLAFALLLALAGCRDTRTEAKSVATEAQKESTSNQAYEEGQHAACLANALHAQDCGKYRVIAYDATWRNTNGNEGEFVLEHDGVSIRAFCGSPSCYAFIDAVGKEIEASKGITGLLTWYLPDCDDKLYVRNALEYRKQMTGKNPTVADVCWQSLVIEKMQAKQTALLH